MVKRLIKFPRGDFTFYEAEPRRETWLIAAGGVILSMHSKTEGRWLMILPQQLICYRNCLLLTLLDNMSAVSSLSASAYRKHQLLSRTRLSYRLLRPISVVRAKWFGPRYNLWIELESSSSSERNTRKMPLNWILGGDGNFPRNTRGIREETR